MFGSGDVAEVDERRPGAGGLEVAVCCADESVKEVTAKAMRTGRGFIGGFF